MNVIYETPFCILSLQVLILKVNWLILSCAILMVTLLTNLSTRFDYSDKRSSSTNKTKSWYHFGHLVDIPISCSPTRSRPSPILFIQVINKTRFFETLVGIGFVRLPMIQGRNDLVIPTMKPLGHRHENATQKCFDLLLLWAAQAGRAIYDILV